MAFLRSHSLQIADEHLEFLFAKPKARAISMSPLKERHWMGPSLPSLRLHALL